MQSHTAETLPVRVYHDDGRRADEEIGVATLASVMGDDVGETVVALPTLLVEGYAWVGGGAAPLTLLVSEVRGVEAATAAHARALQGLDATPLQIAQHHLVWPPLALPDPDEALEWARAAGPELLAAAQAMLGAWHERFGGAEDNAGPATALRAAVIRATTRQHPPTCVETLAALFHAEIRNLAGNEALLADIDDANASAVAEGASDGGAERCASRTILGPDDASVALMRAIGKLEEHPEYYSRDDDQRQAMERQAWALARLHGFSRPWRAGA